MRIVGNAIRIVVSVAICLFCIPRLAFPQSIPIYLTGGGGWSRTAPGQSFGSAISAGAAGTTAVISGDIGAWLTKAIGIAGEMSFGLPPFQVRQTEGGVGRCCAALTRDHRFTQLSVVAKLRPREGLVLLGGFTSELVSTHELRVYTPVGGAPQAPVASDFSRGRSAWIIGGEVEIPLARRLVLVPAIRWSVDFQDLDYELALGRTTLRPTISIRRTIKQ